MGEDLSGSTVGNSPRFLPSLQRVRRSALPQKILAMMSGESQKISTLLA